MDEFKEKIKAILDKMVSGESLTEDEIDTLKIFAQSRYIFEEYTEEMEECMNGLSSENALQTWIDLNKTYIDFKFKQCYGV